MFIDNVYANNPVVTLNDAEGNLTEVAGTVREIAAQRRIHRLANMNIPDMEKQYLDIDGGSYNADEG